MAKYQNRQRIPFKIPQGESWTKGYSDYVEEVVRGVVGLEGDDLVVQFQLHVIETSMSTMGKTKEAHEVEEVRIPLASLASVHKRGWFRRKVTIAANDMTPLSRVEGADGERLVLTFGWRDRHAADELVTALQFALGDLGMARLDHQIAELEGKKPEEGDGRLLGEGE